MKDSVNRLIIKSLIFMDLLFKNFLRKILLENLIFSRGDHLTALFQFLMGKFLKRNGTGLKRSKKATQKMVERLERRHKMVSWGSHELIFDL